MKAYGAVAGAYFLYTGGVFSFAARWPGEREGEVPVLVCCGVRWRGRGCRREARELRLVVFAFISAVRCGQRGVALRGKAALPCPTGARGAVKVWERRCLPAARALRWGARPVLALWGVGGERAAGGSKPPCCRARGKGHGGAWFSLPCPRRQAFPAGLRRALPAPA